MDEKELAFLVGDNPFLGISHLSQEKARDRGNVLDDPKYCARLVELSIASGANGFMFSVGDKTLSILDELHRRNVVKRIGLYAIIPYAFEYVRLSTQMGGFSGLAKKMFKEMTFSRNLESILRGFKGAIKSDIPSLINAYVSYEVHRIKTTAGRETNLRSILLHQAVTDLALAFDLRTFFRSYVDSVSGNGIRPGFNTGNFPYLVKKLKEYGVNLNGVVIAAPFNKVGFQMNPSKEECEETLTDFPEPTVVAISVLAAGYLNPPEAIDYIGALPNIRGVVVGVSKEKHASETFRLIKEKLGTRIL